MGVFRGISGICGFKLFTCGYWGSTVVDEPLNNTNETMLSFHY